MLSYRILKRNFNTATNYCRYSWQRSTDSEARTIRAINTNGIHSKKYRPTAFSKFAECRTDMRKYLTCLKGIHCFTRRAFRIIQDILRIRVLHPERTYYRRLIGTESRASVGRAYGFTKDRAVRGHNVIVAAKSI